MKQGELPNRGFVLSTLADELVGKPDGWRVAIDGVDGVGKTSFAQSLAGLLRQRGIEVTVLHVDDYLNPVDVRHHRGANSPQGYWLDSFDLPRIRRAVVDAVTPVLVEGVFLHRDQLRDLWDLSVFLHASFEVTTQGSARRDQVEDRPSGDARRYVDGQRIYFREAAPWRRATYIVDMTDTRRPEFARQSDVEHACGDDLP